MTEKPSRFIPYGRQQIDLNDKLALLSILDGDFLTTGPQIDLFEQEFAAMVGAKEAVVVNSGTAALHVSCAALNPQPNEAVIVPAVTFLATASAPIMAGFQVILADVDADTGLMQLEHVQAAYEIAKQKKLTVRALLPVHLAGNLCNMPQLAHFAKQHDMVIIEDACHALGSIEADGAKTGACQNSLMSCFSFHPVKTIAMGEGGAITTNDSALAAQMRSLRSHAMERPDAWANPTEALQENGEPHRWFYQSQQIMPNYRASDIACALGRSQLTKLPRFIEQRRYLVSEYKDRLSYLQPMLKLVETPQGQVPTNHLMVALIDPDLCPYSRDTLMQKLSDAGIGTQVHYIPLHFQPYYKENAHFADLSGAESYYRRCLSLPLFAGLTEQEHDYVISVLEDILAPAQSFKHSARA